MTEVGLATLNPPSGEIRQGSIGHADRRLQRSRSATSDGASRSRRRRSAGSGSAPAAAWPATGKRRRRPRRSSVEGWLDSGDLARADEDGYLWFFGRKKQVIVHDGSNISPLEVEGALVEHPAVALAGVVGVHDEVHGENVRAYVTLAEGAERPSRADLIVFCRERIGYKAPEEVVFLDEMPLNPTGKIDRVGLKRMAEDHLHPHGLPE